LIQVMTRYYGWYANWLRGVRRKATAADVETASSRWPIVSAAAPRSRARAGVTFAGVRAARSPVQGTRSACAFDP